MKSPIALGYTRGHFSALVPMESLNERNVGASSSVDVNEDTHVTYLPLVDHEGRLLPIHFQTVEEVCIVLLHISRANESHLGHQNDLNDRDAAENFS